MRGHSQKWSARVKPPKANADHISIFFIALIILPGLAKAAAPAALVQSYQWDMGKDVVMDKAYGIQASKFFNNMDVNTTFSCKYLKAAFKGRAIMEIL